MNFGGKLDKYKKALLLGTGGGNDIVSATLIADYLNKLGIECDVAGMLSPGAVHTFNGENENTINEINNVKRYLDDKDRKPLTFIDDIVPELAKKHNYGVNKFYDFSTRFGTKLLLDDLNSLIEENEYDVFIEVDVGGDILGRVCDDTLLSPMMDFTSLYLLDKVPVDSYLIEFGLGTDGELRPDSMREILQEMEDEEVLLYTDTISINDDEITKFKGMVNDVSEVRIGHTTTMTLKTLEAYEDIETQYYSTYVVGKKKFKHYYDVTLLKETFGKVYLLDGYKLPKLRTETAFEYFDVIQQFIELKQLNPYWKTEMDMCYYNGHIYCLTLSLGLDCDLSEEIIQEALNVNDFSKHSPLIMNNDFGYCEEHDISKGETMSFVFTKKVVRIIAVYKKNLKMTPQKLASQVAHAVKNLGETPQDCDIVVLMASNKKFEEYKNKFNCYVQVDKGLTEVDKGTETVLAYIEE